jgi:hypothetical protein
MKLRHKALCPSPLLAATLMAALLTAVPAAAQAPAGRTMLDMSANAYHDSQYFSQASGTGQAIVASLHAIDITGDPVSNLYGSKQEATASGSVDATAIKLYSRSYAYAQNTFGYYSAAATASAQSSVTTPFKISSAGTTSPPGALGTLVAQLQVSGDVQVDPGFHGGPGFPSAEGRASMYFWATGLNASGCTYYVDAGCLDITRDHTGTHTNSNNALRTWTLHIPFNFDNWSSFNLQMWTGARSSVIAASGGGWLHHQSFSDFAHTLRWGGISEVLDAQGQALSGWSIESLPGLDLRVAAVPEPPNALLWLTAVLLFVAGKKRRART